MHVWVVVARGYRLGVPRVPVGPLQERVHRIARKHERVVAARVGGLVGLEDVRVAEEARHLLRAPGDAHLPPLRRVQVERQDAARREQRLAILVESGAEERFRLVEVGSVK